ncbi:uncharacterized protein LOC132546553 [Ylistrum balloti]|uniref:uncharacterized protein LOC132546553 n=1 Tax=Ylistrum balloti TaxID=509963 RepID=UPI0029059907|nr:uncharacterized protein LOC132546553 [Ylistrum balloti]
MDVRSYVLLKYASTEQKRLLNRLLYIYRGIVYYTYTEESFTIHIPRNCLLYIYRGIESFTIHIPRNCLLYIYRGIVYYTFTEESLYLTRNHARGGSEEFY